MAEEVNDLIEELVEASLHLERLLGRGARRLVIRADCCIYGLHYLIHQTYA